MKDVSGNLTDSKSCHLTIKSLKKTQLGTWACKVDRQEAPFYMVSAHLKLFYMPRPQVANVIEWLFHPTSPNSEFLIAKFKFKHIAVVLQDVV